MTCDVMDAVDGGVGFERRAAAAGPARAPGTGLVQGAGLVQE